MEQVADIDDEVMEKFLEGGATGVDVVSAQLLLHAIRRYAYTYATHALRIRHAYAGVEVVSAQLLVTVRGL